MNAANSAKEAPVDMTGDNKAKGNDMSMDLSGLAQLVDTVRAGNGSFLGRGGEGGGNGGFAPYAGPAVIRADVLANREIGNTGIENIQRSISAGRIADLVVDGHGKICDNINETGNRASDNQFRSELRGADQHAALVAQINANARESDKCCCKLQLQAAEDKAEVLAEIKASEGRAITRDLDRAERKVERLELLNDLRDNGHHGHH